MFIRDLKMVLTVYFLTFVLSVIIALVLICKNRRISNLFVVFSVMIICNSFGRYLIAVSGNLLVALIGHKFLYLGACFCPVSVLFIFSKFCGWEWSRGFKISLTSFAGIIMLLSFTVGKTSLYYKTVELNRASGYYYLTKIYGPAHILYPIFMAVIAFLFLMCLFYAAKNRDKLPFRTVVVVFTFVMFAVVLYFVVRCTHSKVSYVSIIYLAAEMILIRISDRMNMYDMTTNIADSVERMKRYGYIEFDSSYHLVAYNTHFSELFPEVKHEWKIDKKIPVSDSFLYHEIVEWVVNHKEENVKKTIYVQDAYYEVCIRNIIYGRNRLVGYLVELVNRTAEYKYLDTVKSYNEKLADEVQAKTQHISYMKDMMVLGMASMVESRDNSTGGHIKRTSAGMAVFAKQLLPYQKDLNITEGFLKMITRAAPMHDLGKIAVDDRILRKKGRYTPEEYEEMKKHSKEGSRIVESILNGVEDKEFVRIASNVAHYHHEKWNGEGYPAGIKGDNIPLEARIMALVDVFDALVSKRCYKEAFSYDEAFNIIGDSLGTQFDPFLGKIFMEARPEMEKLYNSLNKEQ